MTAKDYSKICLIVCNIIFILGGAAILIIGSVVEITRRDLFQVDSHHGLTYLHFIIYLLFPVGGVIIIMSCLGCFAVYSNNKDLLKIYCKKIAFVFVAEVIVAGLLVYFCIKREKLLEGFNYREKFREDIKRTYNVDDAVTKLLDVVMSTLNCCGFNNYTDFVEGNSWYPRFCCHEEKSQQCDLDSASQAAVIGCFSAFMKWLLNKAVLILGMIICVAPIQFAAMIASWKLSECTVENIDKKVDAEEGVDLAIEMSRSLPELLN